MLTPSTARRIAGHRAAPLLVLGLIVLGLAVLLARLGVVNHNVFSDDVNAVMFGRVVADDPSQAYAGAIARGPERLLSLITAVISTLTDSTVRQLWALHIVTALGQALVAVPVWATARLLGMGRWQALVPATIGAAGAFAMYGVTLLNGPLGVLAAMCMVWAMVRSLKHPGALSDLLVLVTLALLVLARIGWAPLVGGFLPAALAAAWVARPHDEAARTTLRAFPGRLLRRHPVLLPCAVLVVLAILVLGTDRFVGGRMYGGTRLDPDITIQGLWDNSRLLFAHLSIGVAIVPMILAIPVVLQDLVRPTDPVAAGFAWLIVGFMAIFSFAYYLSMNEDRYFAVLAPLVVLAGATAVFRRPPPLWSVALSGLVVARAVVTAYQWPEGGPFDFFVAPTSRFFGRVVIGRIATYAPFGGDQAATLAVLGGLVIAVALVVIARRGRRRTGLEVGVAVAICIGLIAVQVAAMVYPAKKWVDLVGQPTVSADVFNYIDRSAGDTDVRPVAIDGTLDSDLAAQLPLLQVFNARLKGPLAVFRRVPTTPAGPPYAIVAWKTGSITAIGELPRMILEKPGFNAVGFAGTAIPGPPQFSFAQLVRLRQPPRAVWAFRGDAVAGGYPRGGQPIRLRVYPLPDRRACVEGGVATNALAGPAAYRLRTPRRAFTGISQPGAPVRFATTVPAGKPSTLVLRGGAVALPDGTTTGPTIVNVSVTDCDR